MKISRKRNHLTRRKRVSRSTSGAIAAVLLLLNVVIVLLFSSIAIDISHFVAAGSEMQSVVDAAALMGAYDLQWNSTAQNITSAGFDANYMIQHSSSDIYSPGGNTVSASNISITYSSLNGGTNNAITVSMSPPITFLFASMIGRQNQLMGVSATAERLPVASAPVPPWFLETSAQLGPQGPWPLPLPAPAAPTVFPANVFVTFVDSSKIVAGLIPPVLPTFWVDMGLSDLSTAPTNPVGVQEVIACMGKCVTNTNCNSTNPVVIGGSSVIANHGSYNSNISNPQSNSAAWTNGSTVLLPVTTNGNVVSLYAVKLTGPYVPNSFRNGLGVFGEFGIQVTGSADTVPGVTVMSAVPSQIYSNVGATVATLVR